MPKVSCVVMSTSEIDTTFFFATDQQPVLLGHAETWFADGTFHVVRPLFVQLFSLHAFVRSDSIVKQVPSAFVMIKLVKNSSVTMYSK